MTIFFFFLIDMHFNKLYHSRLIYTLTYTQSIATGKACGMACPQRKVLIRAPDPDREGIYTPRRLADNESSKVSDVIIQTVLHRSVRGPKNSTANESGSSGDGPGHLVGCFSQLNYSQCIWGTRLLALSVLNTCHSRLLLSQYFRRGRLFC